MHKINNNVRAIIMVLGVVINMQKIYIYIYIYKGKQSKLLASIECIRAS